MAEEKILTRVYDSKTGEIYYIGTNGSTEKALVKLHNALDHEVDWTQYVIKYQDLTDRTSGSVALSETGECVFSIPLGNKYEVTFPKVGTYQPQSVVYTASSNSRPIEHIYSENENTEEVLDLYFYVKNHATADILNGASVIIKVAGVDKYAGVILNGNCKIKIPYGTAYTVVLPTMTGYRHDHNGEEHTAGIPSREVNIRYFFQDAGILGVDADGERYTCSEIQAKIEAGEMVADDIVAVAFVDDELNASSRGDGTTGCEFMFKIDGSKRGNMAWCNYNLDFGSGQTKVELGEDTMPYVENHGTGLSYMAGMHYTRQIAEAGKKLNDSGVYGVVTTPAATNCMAQTLTLNDGVDRKGYLPGYGQLYRLGQNQEIIDVLYEILGKSSIRPVINSGSWWTSCQCSSTNAVYLIGGGFGNRNQNTVNQVLAVFDL